MFYVLSTYIIYHRLYKRWAYPYGFLCKCCQIKNNNSENKKAYIKYVEEYINNNTPQPFAVPTISLSPPKIKSKQPFSEELPRPHTIPSKSHKKPVHDISFEIQSSTTPPFPPPLHTVPDILPPLIPPIKLPEIPISPTSRQIPVYNPKKTSPQEKSLYESIFDRASKN